MFKKLSRYVEGIKCIQIELLDMETMCEMKIHVCLFWGKKQEISELEVLAKLLSIRKHTENKGFRKINRAQWIIRHLK